MKTVIIPKSTVETVNIADTNANRFYVLKSDSSPIFDYLLILEPKGWIFKDLANEYGHSGHYETLQQAITAAYELESTDRIMEFANILELLNYCVNKKQP